MASMAFILAKSCRYPNHTAKHIDLKSLERCKFGQVEKIKMSKTYRRIHMHLPYIVYDELTDDSS